MEEVNGMTNPQAPINPTVSMDLDQLTQHYGEGYGVSSYGMMRTNTQLPVKHSLEMITWLNNCKNEKGDPKKLVVDGIEPLKKNFADYNSFRSVSGKYDAEWSIHLGIYLLVMKSMTKKAGLKWEPWAEEKLPFIGTRNRQRMMSLAKREDCHKYNFLGVDRLEVLCAATADSKDSDPIGSFMTRNKIAYDQETDFDLEEFKATVDIALNNERLNKGGIEANADLVESLTRMGLKFDKSMIKRAKDVKDSGGDVDKFFKTLSINKGQDATDTSEEKRLKDFNSLSNRLIATIDYILKDDDQLERVDIDALSRLLKRLTTLHKATAPAEKKENEV